MKKISSLRQLQVEKLRLIHERAVVEERMRVKWTALKSSMRPSELARENIKSIFPLDSAGSTAGKMIAGSLLTIGTTWLARKILFSRLNRIFGRKRK
jgi:hypothetical protein